MSIEWWREARFGMFIHWGIYSGLAGFWQGREEKSVGEWIQGHFRIPLAEYRTAAELLTLEKYDAKFWVKLARDAGMKYIILTAKHHDGFAMYDSTASDYNIVRCAPSGRDPLRELADAAREAGMKLGVYYSQGLDWEDPDAAGNDWDFPAEAKDFDRFFHRKCLPQLRELLSNYGEIAVTWFDVPHGIDEKYGRLLREFVKGLQPECLISGRISDTPGMEDYGSFGDNHIPVGKIHGDWETAGTLNHTWGYKANDVDWKPAPRLIANLMQLAGKGANYLLNIGPRGDGSIPEATVEILTEVGRWMQVNGEAIYGTLPSPFPNDFSWGWCTRKGRALYFCTARPLRRVAFSGLKTAVNAVTLPGMPEASVAFRQNGLDFEAEFPVELPELTVFRLALAGEAEVEPMPLQQADGEIILPAWMAQLHVVGEGAAAGGGEYADAAYAAEKFNLAESEAMHVDFAGVLVNWTSSGSYAEWDFILRRPGRYRVEVRTFGKKYGRWVGGHRLRGSVGGASCGGTLRADNTPQTANSTLFHETGSMLGELELAVPGTLRFRLEAPEINPDDPAGVMVKEIILHRC